MRSAAGDTAALRRELGLRDNELVIGLVGNIQPWKGQDVLLRALPHLQTDTPWRCLLIGGTPTSPQGESYHRQLIDLTKSLGIEERVVFTGYRRNVAALINVVDTLVHTSVAPEPFGRVILEGMALGKPVLATDHGGPREIIDDGRTGFLLPPGDISALARCLDRVIGSPALRAQIGGAAAAHVARDFSASGTARAWKTSTPPSGPRCDGSPCSRWGDWDRTHNDISISPSSWHSGRPSGASRGGLRPTPGVRRDRSLHAALPLRAWLSPRRLRSASQLDPRPRRAASGRAGPRRGHPVTRHLSARIVRAASREVHAGVPRADGRAGSFLLQPARGLQPHVELLAVRVRRGSAAHGIRGLTRAPAGHAPVLDLDSRCARVVQHHAPGFRNRIVPHR